MPIRRTLASDQENSATSLLLYTPAQTTPDTAITLTGTYQGDPQALDYNFGSGWIEALSASFSNGVFAITVPGGIPAGSYTPAVRDHEATAVTSSAGTFVVSAWTPETLTTSPGAKAVFEFNANDPGSTVLDGNGAVLRVLNSVDPKESLAAEVATAGNPIVIKEGSGADGDRRVLQFHASKISPGTYDASTDWLGAGAVNGIGGSAGSGLVDLANSTDLATTGSFTTIIGLYIDKSYSYEAGPIWGSLASPGPLQYAQLRYNNGSQEAGAQITDSNLVGANAQSTISAGWHVMTMIKDDGTLVYRLDGQPIAATTITSTDAFKANDFLIGGGFPPASSSSAGAENGVPPPYIGEFQAYSGVLAGTDLVNAEKLAGTAIGLNLTPVNAPCFAAGTRILTLRGRVAVEALQPGDIAVTRHDGCDSAAPIVWVGRRHVDIASHPSPEQVRPIRFAPGALADGSPSRALLLSPDHALLLDGKLIAARQLVNGGSIAVLDMPQVHYFHIELERHGILLAEDAETESYLDTGNRHQFARGGPVVTLHPDFSRVGAGVSCAPFVTDADSVRPIWQRLDDRSHTLGHRRLELACTREADLRLVLRDGCILTPKTVSADGRHVFMLHRQTGALTEASLRSRHAVPGALHPWQDDRRRLGVAVGAIAVWTRRDALEPRRVPLDDGALRSGWWQPESDGDRAWRWTDGNGRLALPDDCVRLDVTIVATTDYAEVLPVETGLRHTV